MFPLKHHSPLTVRGVGGVIDQPKVSVWMVTYNHARFIGKAIDTALSQRTSFPYEIVIGDDRSTDGTREIVLDYQRRHPDRIRVILATSNDLLANVRRVLESCRGEYVALLEGDDYWTDDDKLQLQADLLDNAPDAFVCGARAQVWRDGDAGPSCITPAESSGVLADWGARELFEGRWWFRTCTKMFPSRVLQALPHRYIRDWAMMLWMISQTNFGEVCFLDRVVGVYREHSGGIFSGQTRAHRAMTDAQTLFKVIPLFTGQDRRHLERLLGESVATMLEAGGPSRLAPLRCAGMAALRSPGAPKVWRHLIASARLALATGSRGGH